MRRDAIDIFHVEQGHQAIHARLLNWAAWARVRPNYAQCPMFRALGVKSNSWQWHAPEIRDTIDTLDAMRLEKAVAALPDKLRTATRWWYVFQSPPVRRMCQHLGCTTDGLLKMCADSRTMLENSLTSIRTM